MKAIRRLVRDLSGMGLASAAATAVDALVFVTLLRWSPLPLVADVAFAALAGAVVHFAICRHWVFGRFSRALVEAVPRYALMSGIALGLHAEVTTLLAPGVGPELAWLVSKGLVFGLWCYPASRYLVFGGGAAAMVTERNGHVDQLDNG